MKLLSNLTLLLFFSFFLISCNKTTDQSNIEIKDNKKISKKEVTQEVDNKKEKNNKNIAFIKAELVLQDGIIQKILSKLDILMSSLPKEQVEFIKSLKIENFKGLYFVANKKKVYLKIKGLNIFKIIEFINKGKKTEEYKNFKTLKYTLKNNNIIAVDDKNSYLASGEISIEKLANNFDMNISDKLNSLIKESKNNGFYFSLYHEVFFQENVVKDFPPYLKSLRGVSLYSYKDKKENINKLRFLAKLSEKDAKKAALELDKMYKVYQPMIFSQIKNYENMLLNKKDLKDNEKILYKKLINEFREIANSVDIKVENENLLITVNIKSLESTITIMGVAAAVAIPAYMAYIKKSKAHKAIQENK